eukprot:TRINITY_DN1850_c0_g1_i1.p3 TRINITY_DN1850_c0_g1~~TRINITY_DN1850_c0_g1_i1.p3  ORF type:complete len:208 (-),score=29.95 TRINITY_DN1850_c0_g1_i1:381-965(-)
MLIPQNVIDMEDEMELETDWDNSTSNIEPEQEPAVLQNDNDLEETTPPKSPEVTCAPLDCRQCLLPADQGVCTAIFLRYYFDAETNQCEEFDYGGCEGNENKFQTKEECQGVCKSALDSPVGLAYKLAYQTHSEESAVTVCSRPPKVGPCKAYIPRYYYDPESQQCEQFIYGGCQSNQNNFFTQQQCMQECSSK